MIPPKRNKRQSAGHSENVGTTKNKEKKHVPVAAAAEDKKKTAEYEGTEETPRPTKRHKGRSTQDSNIPDTDKIKKQEKEKKEVRQILVQIAVFKYRGQRKSLAWESWQSRLEQWREDFKEEELAGVVWDDCVTPWEYQEPLKEDQKLAAKICDFETPSEKAGVILHCPVECREEEISNPEIVKLCVGPEKKVLRVNKEILCKKIPYFSKMFQGSFQEAASNSASFPEDDLEAFCVLMHWVRNGNLPPWIIRPKNREIDPLDPDEEVDVVQVYSSFDFIELYALADKFCVFNLMNLITDYVVRTLELDGSWFTIEDISDIYAKAPENSGLRRLACFIFNCLMESHSVMRLPPEDLASALQTIDGLAVDSINFLRSRSSQVDFISPEDVPACEFHDHRDGEICDQKQFKDRSSGLKRLQKHDMVPNGFEYLAY
ncbi:hypothetical protein NHQ30_007896 [Ciborinia camelliae]|nr:hypothetical protein NHQ30_007896 [Ciborinia camelliae]